MFYNDRKTIGVFAENMSNEVQHKVCDGIIREAMAKGYNVALFSSQGSYGQSEMFGIGDLQIFQLPPYEELAGIILILDTMDQKENIQKVVDIVKKRSHCPIVSVRMTFPGISTVLVDNSTCMESVIRHVIEEHMCKRICFMTGPADHFDAIERLESFFTLMEEYHLPVDEHQYFYGDFWKLSGKAAVDHFLSGKEPPEAIICANDYMAVSVASELIGRGYRIPDDVIVAGYDGLDYGLTFSPSITTAEAPLEEMGTKATSFLDEQIQNGPCEETINCKARLCLRESCGCLKGHDLNLMAIRRKNYEDLEQANHKATVFSYMSIQLAEKPTMEGVSDIIGNYLWTFSNLRSYVVCLNRNMSSDHKMLRYTEEMDARVAYKDGQMIPRANLPFLKKDLIPPEFADPAPQVWYFTPLHFLDYTLGYEAFRFNNDQPAGTTFFQFDVILSNSIFETLNYKKMTKMIEELQTSSLHDSLTGLYNRAAFTAYGSQIFEAARKAGKPVFVGVLDMDNLKVINDVYGHVEGDYALKRVASVISKCCGEKYVFARTGGDEYYVIAQGITEAAGEKCLANVEKELTKFNEAKKKEYEIHASSGSYFDVPGELDTLDDFVKVADRFMYHNKLENKKRRGESLR